MPQEPDRTACIAPEALAVEDQRAVAKGIFNPPPLTPAMERAVDRYRVLVKSSRRKIPGLSA